MNHASPGQLQQAIEVAVDVSIERRSERGTNIHDHSSRSHFVIQLYLDFGIERPHGTTTQPPGLKTFSHKQFPFPLFTGASPYTKSPSSPASPPTLSTEPKQTT